MLLLPGGLREPPPEGESEWQSRVAQEITEAVEATFKHTGDRPPLVVNGESTGEKRRLEWPALPQHARHCLGTEKAMRLLDWHSVTEGDVGRARHQDEYLEWRVVRDGKQIRAIEMTTEMPEYWEVLGMHTPERARQLVSEFAGHDVSFEELYGVVDPNAITVDERHRAFAARLLLNGRSLSGSQGLVGAYNDGRKAICCMIHPSNNLRALVRLLAASACPFLVRDSSTGRTRFPSGGEAIAGLDVPAKNGRNSDPLLVERISRFATENRVIALDEPVGIYISNVQRHELAQPDGTDVPAEWLRFTRGLDPDDPSEGRGLFQRLRLELPPDADFAVNDLVVRRTGDKLTYGGQLAALVEVALYVRTSASTKPLGIVPKEGRSTIECDDHHTSWKEYETANGGTDNNGAVS